ncbi:hypothetical protein BCR34DRAFT_564022 [Clohesyomyces aquaticus]|uniref:Uncharacterized protein n=1 Tax=Clohesyomyces aquaticus TaxID=1231657 RepID=A0A1Y1ZPN3_9PLEO|nr:hypothetical protein BCR34DRAFT_564022 [Clohesyomyces aquaticus]
MPFTYPIRTPSPNAILPASHPMKMRRTRDSPASYPRPLPFTSEFHIPHSVARVHPLYSKPVAPLILTVRTHVSSTSYCLHVRYHRNYGGCNENHMVTTIPARMLHSIVSLRAHSPSSSSHCNTSALNHHAYRDHGSLRPHLISYPDLLPATSISRNLLAPSARRNEKKMHLAARQGETL